MEEYIIEGMNNQGNQDAEPPTNFVNRAAPGKNDGNQKRNELAELLYYQVNVM